jgi:heat shock transcription factor
MLYVQGFRKVSPDKWEFAHADFLAGQRHLLVNIRRRRGGTAGSTASPSSAGASGGDRDNSELERLRRDREALSRELMRLRREQEAARAQLLDMQRRVRGTERRQQEQCTTFLERAIGNPAFLDGLLARRGHGGAHVEAGRKRQLLDAAAAAPDALTFEELALAAGAEVEAAAPMPAVAAAQISDTANATDMIWYELLGKEQVEMDAEVEELVAALAATEAVEPWAEMDEKEVEELVAAAAATEAAPEPWAEMDDKEVEELVQQIDCIGSPSP